MDQSIWQITVKMRTRTLKYFTVGKANAIEACREAKRFGFSAHMTTNYTREGDYHVKED